MISGAIGIASMLIALGIVLFKARDKINRADAVVRPAVSVDAGQPDVIPAAARERAW